MKIMVLKIRNHFYIPWSHILAKLFPLLKTVMGVFNRYWPKLVCLDFLAWLVDFKGMSNHLDLSYALRLGNRVHCTLCLHFLCCCFARVGFAFVFCARTNGIRIIFNQIYLTHIWDPNEYYHFGTVWTLE